MIHRMPGGINRIGKSTENKDLDDVRDGETLYLVDTKQIFIYYDGQWYEM